MEVPDHELGLADAAQAVHRHPPALREQPVQGGQLRLATDEVGDRVGRDTGLRHPTGRRGHGTRAGGLDEHRALCRLQGQRAGQEVDGAAARCATHAPFQHADRVDAEPGPPGEVLLRQVGGRAEGAKKRSEVVVCGVGHARPPPPRDHAILRPPDR